MISNGVTLHYKWKCRNVCISIGYYNLHYDMFSLPLGSYDVALGAQGLRTLGSILWDFAELRMQFSVNEKTDTFKGLQPGYPIIMSSHHMENLLKYNSHGGIA